MSSDLKEQVDKHEKEIECIKSSFVPDDEGNPDYESHKKDHEERSKIRETRSQILSDVSSWAVIGIITLMLSHFVQNIKTFLAALGK